MPGVTEVPLVPFYFETDREGTELEWRQKKNSASAAYHDSRFSYNWLTILTPNDLP